MAARQVIVEMVDSVLLVWLIEQFKDWIVHAIEEHGMLQLMSMG